MTTNKPAAIVEKLQAAIDGTLPKKDWPDLWFPMPTSLAKEIITTLKQPATIKVGTITECHMTGRSFSEEELIQATEDDTAFKEWAGSRGYEVAPGCFNTYARDGWNGAMLTMKQRTTIDEAQARVTEYIKQFKIFPGSNPNPTPSDILIEITKGLMQQISGESKPVESLDGHLRTATIDETVVEAMEHLEQAEFRTHATASIFNGESMTENAMKAQEINNRMIRAEIELARAVLTAANRTSPTQDVAELKEVREALRFLADETNYEAGADYMSDRAEKALATLNRIISKHEDKHENDKLIERLEAVKWILDGCASLTAGLAAEKLDSIISELKQSAKTTTSNLLDPAMPTQELRLHMGELTADEVLVARAAIEWANARIRQAANVIKEG